MFGIQKALNLIAGTDGLAEQAAANVAAESVAGVGGLPGLAASAGKIVIETTIALGASATFTGPPRDMSKYTIAAVYLRGTQAIDLSVEGSNDGISNWVVVDKVAATSPTAGVYVARLTVPKTHTYIRVNAANGATAQATLQVETGFIG